MGSNEEASVYNETVLVTGFGPFGVHEVNASFEAVKLLPSLDLERELGVRLVTREIPVVYDYVKSTIPQLWELHKPKVNYATRPISCLVLILFPRISTLFCTDLFWGFIMFYVVGCACWGLWNGTRADIRDSSFQLWLLLIRHHWTAAQRWCLCRRMPRPSGICH